MNFLSNKINEFGEIKVGIVGSGLMGTSLFSQLLSLENFRPTVISSRRKESILELFKACKVDEKDYVITDNFETALKAFKENKYIGTTDNTLATKSELVDAVTDCTGNINAGIDISLEAFKNKVHVVSLNVEMDSTVGPYLNHLAKNSNIVYTGSYGDEPGAIVELFEFANLMGFEILHLGKGKNNELNYYVTEDDVKEDAKKRRISPRMLTSFVDGTNTMIELNAVCNATGFMPDIRGCHMIYSDPKELADKFKLIEDGGIFKNRYTVDFVKGIAPGVYAIVKAKNEIIDYEMQYLSMGKGPNYAIYRPYHLTSLETPISIAKAVVLHESSITPKNLKPSAETVAIAKRDILAGELIEGIGGKSVFGSLEKYSIAKENDLLPIGLINENTKAKINIKKDTPITYNMVCLDCNSSAVIIRNRMNSLIDSNPDLL